MLEVKTVLHPSLLLPRRQHQLGWGIPWSKCAGPWRLVKFLRQKPCSWSGPGAFQFEILFNCVLSSWTLISMSLCLGTSYNPSPTSSNHAASWLCFVVWSEILLQNSTAASASGASCSSCAPPSSSLNSWWLLLTNNLFCLYYLILFQAWSMPGNV